MSISTVGGVDPITPDPRSRRQPRPPRRPQDTAPAGDRHTETAEPDRTEPNGPPPGRIELIA